MITNFFPRNLRATMWVGIMLMLTPSAWSQIDIHLTGTQIDSTKVYDGTTHANIVTLGELPLLPYNQVSIAAEAHYIDASVGQDKPVVVSFSLSGADAGYYNTPSDTILYADITPRQLVADSVQLQSIRQYDGTTYCEVLNEGILIGVLEGDTVYQTVTAAFPSPNCANFTSITVSHHLSEPQGGNYIVLDNALYLGSILKRRVVPQMLFVKSVKEYDGTDTAMVNRQPTPNHVVGSDELGIYATANFDSPEVGDDKTIFTHFRLTGADSANYFVVADSVYEFLGRIIPPITLDTFEDGSQIVADAEGYCPHSIGRLHFRILTGEPFEYRILFSEEAQAAGFTDTSHHDISALDSIISFAVFDNTPPGLYSLTVEFTSIAGNTTYFPATFRINMPNSYLVQTFDDVISIDNSGRLDGYPNRFHTFQWYHNGEEIPAANKPYYQEIGGLTGEYSLLVNRNQEDENKICPKSDFVTMPAPTEVLLIPSPVTTTTMVKLQGFADGQHTLQLFNSYGILLFTTTFEGRYHQLDLSTLPQGTYLVTVDGTSAKTLKL
ncbi:MAG: hypothetical protein J5641_00540 [Bacteroidales bacterium]|nr:hypothetical protein [Bacteroidales bacterium]